MSGPEPRPTLDAVTAAMALPRRRPVLLVIHQHHSNPGHVRRWLTLHGFPLDIRLPRFGDPLPETLEEHTGAIIFGGPMSASDRCAYVRREIDWLEVPLREDKPFLGICLGAQMLARKLGARVGFHPEGRAEIGYWPIRPTPEAQAQFDWPDHVYQWHREGFELPAGATLLAQGEHFPNQAFRYGARAYGLQFHPEISRAMVHRWTIHGAHRLILPGARPPEEHVASHVAHGPRVRRWLGQLLAHWSGIERSDPRWC